jgi:hypothetical protein
MLASSVAEAGGMARDAFDKRLISSGDSGTELSTRHISEPCSSDSFPLSVLVVLTVDLNLLVATAVVRRLRNRTYIHTKTQILIGLINRAAPEKEQGSAGMSHGVWPLVPVSCNQLRPTFRTNLLNRRILSFVGISKID